LARYSLRDDIPLKPEEYRLLRDLFSSRIGIQFGPESRFAMERRLRERLAILKLTTFAEYYQYLRFNPGAPGEWEEAIELLDKSPFVREVFGDLWVDVYVVMLRHELELFARHVTEFERERYREVM